MPTVVYADAPETILREEADPSSRAVNHVLLGTVLDVDEEAGDWLRVVPRRAGRRGWVHKDAVSVHPALKIFFVDVGQGDGALVEAPQGTLVVDAGPGDGFHRFIRHRYKPIFDRGEGIDLAGAIMSHPDLDHYGGILPLLEDEDIRIGTLYHNGICRCPEGVEKSATQLEAAGLLSRAPAVHPKAWLMTPLFDTLADAEALAPKMSPAFKRFWAAARKAHQQGRLQSVRRLAKDAVVAGFAPNAPDRQLRIRVLGPVLHAPAPQPALLCFDEPASRESRKPTGPRFGFSHSHTRNGHSIVLRLELGDHSILLGGDLNIPAERHLMAAHPVGTGGADPLLVTVAKACHHGSSDFSPAYMKRVSPFASVISSGDNASFDHPMADALGAAAHFTRGDLPLVFSTELGRAYQLEIAPGAATSAVEIHYGLVNLRSNGKTLVMAQMKESHAGRADVWDSFTVPWEGKFWHDA
ncbi:MAG: MBL fold metallo-hydrolase [Planctomycetota bacterium]|nr:MBL fold metallo-hydrolase [Planctomycetota bacterium]